MSIKINTISFKTARRRAAQTIIKVRKEIKTLPRAKREDDLEEAIIQEEGTALGAITALIILLDGIKRREAITGERIF